MNRIRESIGEKCYWISVDETTDIKGRFVANLLIGKLDGKAWHAPFLISVKFLEKVDHANIARFVDEGLGKCRIFTKLLIINFFQLRLA